MDYLNYGRQVLDGEIQALKELRDRLDDNFTNAVRATKSCKGKVIVTGLGKSGHIGKKIAATMASLGIPSFFLHSAEALHGDTGMIQARDLVIAISNSGTTREVVETAARAKEIGCKLIVMTGNLNSPLGKLSDIQLCIHVEKESDHINLAPTSSSTVTLALGDALAVTVSRAKQFTADDFSYLHSGGALGLKAKKTIVQNPKIKWFLAESIQYQHCNWT